MPKNASPVANIVPDADTIDIPIVKVRAKHTKYNAIAAMISKVPLTICIFSLMLIFLHVSLFSTSKAILYSYFRFFNKEYLEILFGKYIPSYVPKIFRY